MAKKSVTPRKVLKALGLEPSDTEFGSAKEFYEYLTEATHSTRQLLYTIKTEGYVVDLNAWKKEYIQARSDWALEGHPLSESYLKRDESGKIEIMGWADAIRKPNGPSVVTHMVVDRQGKTGPYCNIKVTLAPKLVAYDEISNPFKCQLCMMGHNKYAEAEEKAEEREDASANV